MGRAMSFPRRGRIGMKPRAWLLAVCLILAALPAAAQTGKSARLGKLTETLIDLQAQQEARAAGLRSAPLQSANPLTKLVEERVVINAVAEDDAETLKAELEALGMENAVAFGRIVSGQLPVSAIADAAGLRSLRFAREAMATTHAGSVTSQGDTSMRSGAARSTFGVDGAGVKVGVLSDSFNCKKQAAGDVSSGDLSSVNVLQDETGGGSGTGAGGARLETAHAVAPGAALAFASAFNGWVSFAANIQALQAAGARVIVDDVVYFDEPMFQDGPIAQAVDSVVAAGAAYFSAAGNEARQSYDKAFKAGTSFAQDAFLALNNDPTLRFWGGIAHNFASSGTDVFQSVTIPAGKTVTISLQWDSLFFSVSGAPGSQNDLDIYLLNSSNRVVASSATINVGHDAVEVLQYKNPGSSLQTLNLMIVKFSGANPGRIKYVYFGPMTVTQYDTQSSAIYGHANATGAEAVGAAFYAETPEFGQTPPLLESSSSVGGTPVLFDTSGNPTNDPRADKPEITAPDGVNTTFFFPGDDVESDGHPNFFGTSAAAPHAAAVAALLLQVDPTFSPDEVYTALENSAIDMGAPGFDNAGGFGLIQADAAVNAGINQLTATDLSVSETDSPDPVVVNNSLTYTLTVANRGFLDATGVTLTDTLPGSVNLVSAVPSQGNCSGTTTITCNLGGILKHATATVTIVVATTVTGQLSNTASVALDQTDFDPTNNSATQLTSVIPMPLTVAAAPAEGDVPLPYTFDLQIGGGAPPYTVSIIAGAPPAGLSLDPSTGVVSGTPIKYSKKVSIFTVRATDSSNSSITRQYAIKIFPAPAIGTKGLKNGSVGTSYSAVLKAKGGKSPYAWDLSSGSLPAGLTLSSSGAITGVPAGGTAGIYNLTLRVADGLGQATKPVTLTIQ